MALELKKSTTQKNDGTEVYIEVVDATGVYDAVDNVGGFGTPNPERNTLALVFYGNIEKSTGDVLLVPDTHDPLTVTSYTFLLNGNQDGVWHFWVFAIPIFDDMVSYNDGDIVYDNQDPVNPFIKKQVEGVFQPIEPALLTLETSVTQLEEYDFIIPTASDFVQDLNHLQLQLLNKVRMGKADPDEWSEKNIQYVHARDTLNSATLNFCKDAYTLAQIDLEEVLNEKEALNL